jgi:hypothetical protein
MRRPALIATLALAASMVFGATAAQAVVVDMGSPGAGASVPYNAANVNSYYGVEMVAGTKSTLATAGYPAVSSNAPCTDPALTSDLTLAPTGLCSHGGPVIHADETFALTWDPNPHSDYASHYVEQFLRDVADGSGTFSNPFALTPQYTDSTGRAAYSSLFGGGYYDAGSYPASGCPVSGTDVLAQQPDGTLNDSPNDVCLTDAQLRVELGKMVAQNGILGRTQPGHQPLLTLLTPPGVVVCLDSAGKVCSNNSDPASAPAQFCSYHAQAVIDGDLLQYVVQPWSSLSGAGDCDEPDAPQFTGALTASELVTLMGSRLVGPLSEGMISAIVNPSLNGWFALDGSEAADNGCVPLTDKLDQVTVGSSGQNPYFLQRDFNNGGALINNPFAPGCAGGVVLQPSFVVPSAVNEGDVVQFDGSKSPTALVTSRAKYVWNLGDGTVAYGPSLTHQYTKGGVYTVTLTMTDRGGNVASASQTITVLGANGSQPVTKANGATSKGRLSLHMQLMPQSFISMLRNGVAVRVTSNEAADGLATLSIPRRDADRAGLSHGHGRPVVIGRGTISHVANGTGTLHLRISRKIAAKLKRLHHTTVTVRLALIGSSGARSAIDAAGRY